MTDDIERTFGMLTERTFRMLTHSINHFFGRLKSLILKQLVDGGILMRNPVVF